MLNVVPAATQPTTSMSVVRLQVKVNVIPSMRKLQSASHRTTSAVDGPRELTQQLLQSTDDALGLMLVPILRLVKGLTVPVWRA